ncbi:MAG: glycosyltransferase family 4 protein [Verrucomicrobiota bacterium]
MNPLKVGIIGLKCYDHLIGAEVPRYLGGIETQLATLAKGLVAQGCEVSLITYDHGQPDDEIIAGVRVIKSHPPESGLPMIRAIHPRTSGLFRAMKSAAADIYLQMGAGMETGQTAIGSRILGRPMVFCLASDANFGSHLSSGRWGIEGKAYRFGLKSARRIVAQTGVQRDGLRQATGLESTIIPMAVLPPSGEARRNETSRILWVGRITPGKRLDWLLEAAKRLPNFTFDIVGTPNRDSEHATQLMEEARCLPNVVVHGRAPVSILVELYAGASLLACTSELEGFPTTFLEAWSIGLPVVTTFDPDGVVAKNELGLVAEDLEDFISKLGGLLQEDATRQILADNALKYFEENHSVSEVCRRFGEMLEDVCQR